MPTWDEMVREISELQKAPPGKYRVVGVDMFAWEPLGEPYVIADCDDQITAINLAKSHGSEMNPCYVYDDTGAYVFGAGKP